MPNDKTAKTLPRLADRSALGRSGLRVSPFCLGMIEDPDTVLAAYDAGINFFFVTTDMHWPLYESLRVGLRALLARGGGIRDEIVVVGMSYVANPSFLEQPFCELVDAIPGLGRIDVCAVGGCDGSDLPARRATILAHRERAFSGCRAAGASFHDRLGAAAAHAEGVLDIAYLRYNADHHGAREDVFPFRGGSPTLLYGFKSLGGWAAPSALEKITHLPKGLWLPRPPDHYRFALSSGGLDGLLCSPRTPAEIRALAEAMEKGPLSVDEQEHLIDLAALARGDAHLVPDPA